MRSYESQKRRKGAENYKKRDASTYSWDGEEEKGKTKTIMITEVVKMLTSGCVYGWWLPDDQMHSTYKRD